MSTKISFQALAKTASGAANTSISNIPKGRYNVYISGLFHNVTTFQIIANYCVCLNVNGDNQTYDTIALRSWTHGIKMLTGNSVLQVQGSIEVYFTADYNIINARSYLNTGSVVAGSYNNQNILLITKKFNQY